MIEGRRKGALIMGLMWIAVAAVVMLYLPKEDVDAMMWIWLLSSLIVMVCGIVVYLGFYMLIAGVNTMTANERSRYDMDKITSFMGISLVLTSLIFYLAWPLSVLYGFLMFGVMIALFIAAVLFMVIYLNTKRFKADTYKKL